MAALLSLHDTSPRQDTGAAAKPVKLDALPRSLSAPSRSNADRRAAPVTRETGDKDRYVVKNLAAQFDSLAALANGGDIDAARALYDALLDCHDSPVNARELDDFRRNVSDPSSLFATMTPDMRQRQIDERTRLYARCGDLSSFQHRSLADWALLVAEAGDAEARRRYAFVGKPTDLTDPQVQEKYEAFVARAKGYLNEAIDHSDASALAAMATAYLPSVIRGNEQPFGIDPEQAYAYFYAYGLTGDGDEMMIHTTKGTYNTIDGNLAKLEEQLTPEQIASARAKGQAIFDRCCRKPSE